MRRRSIVTALVVLALSAGGGVAIAAFSATATNSANSFTAASTFGGMRLATGQYTGNSTAGRAVAVPFQPDAVIVKANAGTNGVMRTSSMTGDQSKFMAGATALTAGLVQSLTATGFTVGTNVAVNQTGTTYDWIAFMGYSKQMKVGSYTGNGGASQSITGAGFSPDYAIVMGANARAPIQRSASMTGSFRFDQTAAVANGITSLDSDGFSVGNSNQANSTGIVYHYVAWNEIPGLIKEGSYSGDGSDNRSITGATFQPEYALVKSSTTGTNCDRTVHRGSSLTGDSAHHFANVANLPNLIQALQGDGFQIGNDCRVNTGAKTYYWVAFRNNGCPSQKTISASADSWADQVNTGTNYGGDPQFKVVSRTGQVGRAFVQFPLPALPVGCSVTSAQLRLYDAVPTAGRTLNAARVSAAWTEGAVNWTNQPGVAGGTTSATTPATAGWMQWDVTAQIQAMYSGSNYGLRIVDATEFGFTTRQQQFDSREAGSNTPELVLTFG